MPNAEHSLAGQDYFVILQVAEFINRFINNTLPESLDYTLIRSNTTGIFFFSISNYFLASIIVRPELKPHSVTLWQATTLSHERRDFRLFVCGQIGNPACYQPVLWLPQSLSPAADGSYSASIKAPAKGWIGFLIEVEYRRDGDSSHYMEVTSEVNIVPDIYPFPRCGNGKGCL